MNGGRVVEEPSEGAVNKEKRVAVKVAEGQGRWVSLSCHVESKVAGEDLGGNIWYDFENLKEVVARDTVMEGAGEATEVGKISKERSNWAKGIQAVLCDSRGFWVGLWQRIYERSKGHICSDHSAL